MFTPRSTLVLLASAASLALAACDRTASRIAPTAPTAPPAPILGGSASASLVECPSSTPASAATVIGLLGGTVSVGGTTVTIPSGALLLPTQITLTVPASRYMEIDVTVAGSAHFVFERPVTVTLDYGRCARGNILSAPLSVWYIDSQTKRPLERMIGVDDKLARRVTFTTGHFSGYALAN